jgi:hypothetical protein
MTSELVNAAALHAAIAGSDPLVIYRGYMNHKRKRPKKQRAGCLFCKPHKRNGVGEKEKTKPSLRRKMQDDLNAGVAERHTRPI